MDVYLLASSRLVWFQLVDSNDGQPYKQSTPTSVQLDPGTVIDQFRKAVKAEYDQPDYLKNVPAGILSVFRNKSSFDKRDCGFEKEEPLDVSDQIGSFGSTSNDCLVVSVPRSHSFNSSLLKIIPFIDSLRVKYHKFDETITKLSDIFASQPNNGIIELGTVLPPFIGNVSKIFIRQDYTKLFDLIFLNRNSSYSNVLVSGTPGIGKTLFLIYCAYRLVQEYKKTVYLQFPNSDELFIINIHGSVCVPAQVKFFPYDQEIYYLVDSVTPLNVPKTLCVLTSSPRLSFANEFCKIADKYYMPPWTWDELETMINCLNISFKSLKLNDIKQRFEILNGVPRLLYTEETVAEDIVKKYVIDSNAESLLTQPINCGKTDHISHTLILYQPDDSYRNYINIYASRYVSEQVYEMLKKYHRLKMQTFVKTTSSFSHLAGLRDQLYERIVHDTLRQGGTFKRRVLHSNGRKSNATSIVLPMSSHVIQGFSKLREAQSKFNQLDEKEIVYFQPNYEFEAVDFWMQNVGMFQITVRKDHELKCLIHEVSAFCQSDILYFVVPDEELFKNYRYVKPELPRQGVNQRNIKQYVLWVPLAYE